MKFSGFAGPATSGWSKINEIRWFRWSCYIRMIKEQWNSLVSLVLLHQNDHKSLKFAGSAGPACTHTLVFIDVSVLSIYMRKTNTPLHINMYTLIHLFFFKKKRYPHLYMHTCVLIDIFLVSYKYSYRYTYIVWHQNILLLFEMEVGLDSS